MNIHRKDGSLKTEKNKTQECWLSMGDASDFAGISVSSLRRAVKNGEIRNRRVGGNGKILFHRSWISAWILGYDSNNLTSIQKQEISELLGSA